MSGVDDIKELDPVKVFESIKVSWKVIKRLSINNGKRAEEIRNKSGCDIIQFVAKVEDIKLSQTFNQQMINYLFSTYFNVPKQVPIIVFYGQSASTVLAKDFVAKICKNLVLKKQLNDHIRLKKKLKNQLKQYEESFKYTFKQDKTDKKKGKKKKNNIKTKQNEYGYDQIGANVYYVISLSAHQAKKLNKRKAFKSDQYGDVRKTFKMDYIKEKYKCKIFTYYNMTKITRKDHLQFLKLKFGDNVSKQLPIFLFFTAAKKAKNMKNAIKYFNNRLKQYS